MNPFQRLVQAVGQWIDRRAEASYRKRPDPYIRDTIEPVRARLAEREERLAASSIERSVLGQHRGTGRDRGRK